jgi:hypothetical protein
MQWSEMLKDPRNETNADGYMSKHMQNDKIHVFSSNMNITEHLRYNLRYIRIHQDTLTIQMYPSGYTHDTSVYIRIRIR